MKRPGANPKKGSFARCVKAVSKRGRVSSPSAVCAASKRRTAKGAKELERAAAKGRRKKRNPAADSLEAYKDFHGKEADELVTVTKKVHFHRHLAGAGTLEFIRIRVKGKQYVQRLEGFKGAILAFNEKRDQMFIEGGDQRVPLQKFGIIHPHEVETLGEAVEIGYFTTKTHLGKDGGTAVYEHKFRVTNENGRHITVRIARYPDVIYRVLDEQLEFSGGSYRILSEGIDR